MLELLNTVCCGHKPKRVRKLTYLCSKCGTDVSMEVAYYALNQIEEEECLIFVPDFKAVEDAVCECDLNFGNCEKLSGCRFPDGVPSGVNTSGTII